MSGQLHTSAALLSGKGAHVAHWLGGWVAVEINLLALSGIKPEPHGLPARSPSDIPILKWISKNITCFLDSAGLG